MNQIRFRISLLFLIFFTTAYAQHTTTILQPGFDKQEYIEMLKITARQVDTPWTKVEVPAPVNYNFVYRSKVVGLHNMWDLWLSKKEAVAVISLRGTTGDQVSWLANFYAGMVPASGRLQLDTNFTFDYHLAEDPRAAVHVGWLVGMAYLQRDILPKIDECYKKGIHDIIILGHSQGGAIAYLLTSYLEDLKRKGAVPSGIRFKTYCSAAPKPGNLFYAYEYENLTRDGWAYNVVSSADWVPETPFSVQTVHDFVTVNPFTDAKKIINKQKFPIRFALRHIYNKLDRPTIRSQRNFEKYLGRKAYSLTKKTLPNFRQPAYVKSSDYVRTGTTIVLMPDADYYKKYPDDKSRIFVHHFPGAYLYLAEKLEEKGSKK